MIPGEEAARWRIERQHEKPFCWCEKEAREWARKVKEERAKVEREKSEREQDGGTRLGWRGESLVGPPNPLGQEHRRSEIRAWAEDLCSCCHYHERQHWRTGNWKRLVTFGTVILTPVKIRTFSWHCWQRKGFCNLKIEVHHFLDVPEINVNCLLTAWDSDDWC